MLIINIIFILLIPWSNAQESCTTPNARIGTCLLIDECKTLREIYNDTNRTLEESRKLKNLQCGEKNRQPKLCCELEEGTPCITPDNVNGTCIELHKCPTLISLFDVPKPLPSDIVRYLNASSCVGPAKYSVCCSDQKVSVANRVNTIYTEEMCGIGVDNDRVVGGDVAGIDEFPWMALIEYTIKNGKIIVGCGGTLISKKHVLTAGHCVKGEVITTIGEPTNIRLGEYDKSHDGPDCITIIGTQDCNDELVIIPIEKIILHPDFIDVVAPKNDIAIIRMERETNVTYFVMPICLPRSDIGVVKSKDLHLTVAGWGLIESGRDSDKKLYVNIPYVEFGACKKIYDSKSQLWDKQICAGGDKGKDSCRGDSGGPLMHRGSNELYEITGIVSFGPNSCGQGGIPAVYTKVFAYLDWIKTNLK